MATINLALNVQVVGGPKVLISKSKSVQAYDKIEVSIAADGMAKSVEVQPGDAADVSFLLIQSSVYSSDLKYFANNGINETDVNNSATLDLDEPHLYWGKGAISALGVAPKILKFTNNSGEDAAIAILVGRDAVSDPDPVPDPDS